MNFWQTDEKWIDPCQYGLLEVSEKYRLIVLSILVRVSKRRNSVFRAATLNLTCVDKKID